MPQTNTEVECRKIKNVIYKTNPRTYKNQNPQTVKSISEFAAFIEFPNYKICSGIYDQIYRHSMLSWYQKQLLPLFRYKYYLNFSLDLSKHEKSENFYNFESCVCMGRYNMIDSSEYLCCTNSFKLVPNRQF